MASINKTKKTEPIYTHEGGKAVHINPEMQLRRSVMTCMLWENNFYEDGVSIATRITELVAKIKPEIVAQIAIEARNKMNLRHVPLLIARSMTSLDTHKHLVSSVLADVIQRPDELCEYVALYWQDKKAPLSAQSKKGLARAFCKFNEFQLAKYNRKKEIMLRDVLRLCHAKPTNDEQNEIWKRLIADTMTTPDTWEVALSAGADKKATWERLINDRKLGGLALLRNLRNMQQVGVKHKLIVDAIKNMKTNRILPYRFIAAARYAPNMESYLEERMTKCLEHHEKLSGHTVLLVDVSGSMDSSLSNKSDLTRLDAACGVAMLVREICDHVDIFTFSDKTIQIPSRRGFALRDAIVNSQIHNGTYLGKSVEAIYSSTIIKAGMGLYSNKFTYNGYNLRPDHLIVITDEQSHDRVPNPVYGDGFMINVAAHKHGVGYGKWLHIDGFSEAVIDYIQMYLKQQNETRTISAAA